jgi:hypothetical protein
MAKDNEFYNEMRNRGVRKRLARKVSSSLASRKGDESPKAARRAIADLSSAVSAIETRMATDESRHDAAVKAAKTRRKRADKRSKGAQQLAAGSPGS